jgi:glycosyltransferase involved in cell wall biosynthesis
VVCDDGSTDRTSEILATFGDAIEVVAKPNGGLSTARNAALALATGEYVVLLDADDTWHPERLDKIAAHIQRTGDDIVTTDARFVTEEGKLLHLCYEVVIFPPKEEHQAAILSDNFLFVGCAVRRSLLTAIGGFDERAPRQGEYETWIRLLLRGASAGLVREPLVDYLRHPGSMSADPTYGTAHEIYALEQALTADRHLLDPELASLTLARLKRLKSFEAKTRALELLRDGNPGARRAALHATTVNPSHLRSRLKYLILAAIPRRVARLLLGKS